MGLDRKIKLIRGTNIIGNIYPLCAFYVDNYDSKYIVYAKDDNFMDDDSNIVYFGKLKEEDSCYLVSIIVEEELSYVKRIIKDLFKYSLELEEIKKDKLAFNKKLEIPRNIFENPYNGNNVIDSSNDIDDVEDKSRDNREYRNRLKSLAEDIKDIRPVDKDVPDTLFVNYYNEMGMLLKSKLSTLKQLWVEYQLIYNERQIQNNEEISYSDIEENSIDTFDEVGEYEIKDISSDFYDLLDSLSNRIEYINNYLDELRELKKDNSSSDYTKINVNDEKEKLRIEKEKFEEYKKQEEEKIRDEKKELQLHFNKFQSIVDSFDKKIKEVK